MGITIALITKSVAATGLAAGLAVGGVHVASAATPAAAPADITLPSGGVLEHRVTGFCNRVPNLIKRVDQAQTRLSGDADTKGSLAWLKARQAKAEKNGRAQVVNRLDRRIERRTERLAKLPGWKKKLTAAQSECATLDLPAPSASPSSTS
jgi:hypothetical protein